MNGKCIPPATERISTNSSLRLCISDEHDPPPPPFPSSQKREKNNTLQL